MTKKMLSLALIMISSSPALASDFYKVTVTRQGQDLYKIDGKGVYIKTRFCYEYAYSQEAILQIDSPGGYNIGKIIFVSSLGANRQCDVEKVLS